ncbi:hypothetical protein N7298_21470, partial [Aeromonas caviae]|uniref:hypothetical protein n=1 Tax=Aeromonas caviae TaxID=648 RepID=UPI00244CB276
SKRNRTIPNDITKAFKFKYFITAFISNLYFVDITTNIALNIKISVGYKSSTENKSEFNFATLMRSIVTNDNAITISLLFVIH